MMKDLAQENADEIMNGCEDLTGLKLFMVAGMGEYHKLNAVYEMMRVSPEIIPTLRCLMNV